ncbi:ABC transporter permease [Natronomonas salsuginis]|uniref:ABC transporter permease n=1 Tax=Natronomonas salsuginis TaxID=2217661 RepID=A0A4V6XUM2_9EURY|nr:ABC transporter permease [Natronomonas salsuginis]TKR25163.1 ABC transporter permease [Natronomonas salsuginis]
MRDRGTAESVPLVGKIKDRVINHYLVRNTIGGLQIMLSENSVRFWFSILVLIAALGIFGPIVAPYDYDERHTGDDGTLKISEPPSLEHPLGTNDTGQDVFSILLYGARPTLITGALGFIMISLIGGTVGVTSGYVGGTVDNLLMRFTDLAYGIPLIPFALVALAFFGIGFYSSILVITLIIWRGSARVIRSQVLQVKERPYVLAAKATGASTPRIILKHILPNVGTMVMLFGAIGVGATILIQASLAYIGVANTEIPSWGMMIQNAQSAGMVSTAWWWSIPPGMLISVTVLATFMFARGYERVARQTDSGAAVVGV